eukprot:19605-Heterococcus_DN1.PRE.2
MFRLDGVARKADATTVYVALEYTLSSCSCKTKWKCVLQVDCGAKNVSGTVHDAALRMHASA